MRFILFLILLIQPAWPLWAQNADVDGLSRDLDLSILDKSLSPAADLEGNDEEVPASHLFVNFELINLPPAPESIVKSDPEASGLMRFTLPAAPYVVIANPARMDLAYEKLSEVLRENDLETTFPFKVALHADGNFSLAWALSKKPQGALPLGIDLSPFPEMSFAGVFADIQLLRKDHPPVLEAFTRLQAAARAQNIELERLEFYFFPLAPGRVLFALRVKQTSATGN